MPRDPSSRPAGASDLELSRRLLPLIERGLARAGTTGRAVLVCATEPMPAIDPLDVVEDHVALQMYWAVPRDDFSIAGLGSVATIEGSGSGRFSRVGDAWVRLAADAIVENGSASVAPGPLLMGGFSFDPEGPASDMWDGYPAASFVVPQVAVVRKGPECWLHLCALVDDESDADAIVADLDAERARILTRADLSGAPGPGAFAVAVEADAAAEAAWRSTVARAVQAIREGALEKVVLARQVDVRLPGRGHSFDPRAALRHLRETQPAAFVFGIWRDDAVFLGATPERLVVLRDGEVETSVLAGSAPRGSTPADDAAQSAALRASDKDREEHEIVRRDIHRALAGVCDGVTSPEQPSLLTLPAVHHLHTAVRGRLARGRSVFDVIERLHPTPALGGAPRDAALRFIAAHEDLDRGWYAAPLGWVAGHRAEFAVALRSALVRGRRAVLFAGCGIVAQSDPDAEFAESALKLTTALNAVAAGTRSPGA